MNNVYSRIKSIWVCEKIFIYLIICIGPILFSIFSNIGNEDGLESVIIYISNFLATVSIFSVNGKYELISYFSSSRKLFYIADGIINVLIGMVLGILILIVIEVFNMPLEEGLNYTKVFLLILGEVIFIYGICNLIGYIVKSNGIRIMSGIFSSLIVTMGYFSCATSYETYKFFLVFIIGSVMLYSINYFVFINLKDINYVKPINAEV